MNDDALKKLWREQPLAPPSPLNRAQQMASIKRRMNRFDRTIGWRDLRELAAAGVIIVWFGCYFFLFPSFLARTGCVITILSAVFIDWRLISSKRQAGKEQPGAPVLDALRLELRKVQTQIRLLRSVLWWYILPLAVGCEVFFFGLHRNAIARVVSLIVWAAMGLALNWVNQLAVRKQLLPLKEELESLLGIPPELRTDMKRNPMQTLFLMALLIAGLVALFFGAARLMAQEKPPTDAQVQSMLQTCVDQQRRAPGIVVGMIDAHGARVYARGVRDTGKPGGVQADTVFEIGSITKVFTALLLQDMVDRGEVKLDDPIGKFLPPSVKTPSRAGRQITLLDLATQTSGLPRMPDNFAPKDGANPYADYTVEQLYDFLSRYQLTRDIGTKYEYSNLGGGLLGLVLALRAGTDYEALVVRRICEPLHLDSTRVTLSPELKSRLATGHNAMAMPVSNWDIPTLAGAGALRSTAKDLLAFVAANLGLTNSSLSHAIRQTHLPRQSTGLLGKIGLMWQIDSAHDTLWHNGGTGGCHSYIGFKMADRRGVVVLANSQNDIDDIGQYLLGDRAGVKDFTPPKVRHPISLDSRVLDQYVGQYKFSTAPVTMTMSRDGNRFFGQLTGQQKFEFFPESESDFFCREVDAQLTFVKDPSGAVAHVILHQNGIDQKVTRVK